ncbi:caspase family protein [Allokutzneria sp. A3M-2-11 16]|uniref:caspase family protein n=1 Tax=Allokutzneria sp. A3M-2-11 16 TaxID=2962043 RepID=UPI0020B7CECB|nr:caspase family protein [Allokutzneria sp. A3M-2-11 16]MCP3802824.1 caspase family protein [Allokutzneria sp. A3M-2-11 16]
MTRLPDPELSRAVLIGTSRFDHPGLGDLPAVRNNLADLAAILTSATGTGLKHCAVLADEADIAAIGVRLAEAAERAEDLLLVYYAGHGLVDGRGELHLTVPSTHPERLGWTSLPFAMLRETLADAGAKNRVLILDCCFSGRAVSEFMSADAVPGQLEIDGTYTLTATPANKVAMAPVGATHTLFTGELITLLAKGIEDGPELLSLGEIYQRLLRIYTRRNLPKPQQGSTRTTELLALSVNRALHPDEPDAAALRYAALVADRTKTLGPDHPGTLKAREQHAYWLGRTGAVAEAARLHAALLADRTRVARKPRRTSR